MSLGLQSSERDVDSNRKIKIGKQTEPDDFWADIEDIGQIKKELGDLFALFGSRPGTKGSSVMTSQWR